MSNLGKQLIKALGGSSKPREIWDLYKHESKWFRIKRIVYFSPITDFVLEPYYKIRHFVKRVIRIAQWLPVLWKTHDWDHSYMTTIWSYSLQRLKTGTLIKGHHVTTKKDFRVMDTAIALLNRISGDDYTDAHYEAFYRKWGKSDYQFEPTDKTKKFFRMKNKIYEELSPRDKEVYNKEFRALMDLEDYLYKQDVELFGKLLKKHLKSWWD